MSINFFLKESVYSASHLSTVLPLVGWYGARLECVKPSRLQAWVQECKWHCSWINFVMECTTLCWQAKALMLLGSNNWHLVLNTFRSRIAGRLIHIFLHYIGFWVEHPDLLSQILQLRVPVSRTVKTSLIWCSWTSRGGKWPPLFENWNRGLVKGWACSRSSVWDERCVKWYHSIESVG